MAQNMRRWHEKYKIRVKTVDVHISSFFDISQAGAENVCCADPRGGKCGCEDTLPEIMILATDAYPQEWDWSGSKNKLTEAANEGCPNSRRHIYYKHIAERVAYFKESHSYSLKKENRGAAYV